jgi:hypothetical protein
MSKPNKHFFLSRAAYSMAPWKLLVTKNNIGVPDPHCYIQENLCGIEYVVDSVRNRQWPVDDVTDLMQQVSVRVLANRNYQYCRKFSCGSSVSCRYG